MIESTSLAEVSVHLVTWNGERFLPKCLASLEAQTFQNWKLSVFDNGSTDSSVALVQAWIDTHGGQLTVSQVNTGFAKAHNALIRQNQAPFIFVVNQDTEFTPDYLEHLYEYAKNHPDVASVTGLLYRSEVGTEGIVQTSVVDSAGLSCYVTHRVVERTDVGDKKEVSPVFGVPATLALYRREALEVTVLESGDTPEYFDESFGSYKEDVDLSYRFALLGWKNMCLPTAVGYHVRGLRAGDDQHIEFGSLDSIRHRRQKSEAQNIQSYANHLMFLFADFFFPMWSMVCWNTVAYEVGKFFVLLVTEPKTLVAWKKVLDHRADIQRKRQALRSKGANWRRVRALMT